VTLRQRERALIARSGSLCVDEDVLDTSEDEGVSTAGGIGATGQLAAAADKPSAPVS
jgi:hypothetical protein